MIYSHYISESKKKLNISSYKNLYFLSNTSMDQVLLQPRIPDNYLIKNGYEDNKTKRVCFAPTIDKCLMGLSRNLKGEKLCVHKAVNFETLKMKKPSLTEVPDSGITDEVWILEPVEIKYIGDIKVIADKGLDGHKFVYGDKEAELYDWEWKWIKKIDNIDESNIRKSIDDNVRSLISSIYDIQIKMTKMDYFKSSLELDKEIATAYNASDMISSSYVRTVVRRLIAMSKSKGFKIYESNKKVFIESLKDVKKIEDLEFLEREAKYNILTMERNINNFGNQGKRFDDYKKWMETEYVDALNKKREELIQNESNIVNEGIIKNNTDDLDSIRKLVNSLKDFKYGVLKNNSIQSVGSAKEWDEYYRYLSPKEFEKYKGGACWDFVAYQTEYLSKTNIKFDNYYLEMIEDPDKGTHTISVIRSNNKYYYLECINKFAGIYEFSDLDSLFDFVLINIGSCNKNNKNVKYNIYKYKKCNIYGSNCDEYMEWMRENATFIKSKKCKYIKANNINLVDIISESTVVNEASKPKVKIKTTKRYKCPFCDVRLDREKLVYHIEDEHEELIPENYTAARVVFNHINNKERGSCIVCGRETKWKEETWKYARLCEDPKCSKALSDKADKNMKSKLGYTAKELLKNPEHQNKMLKGRKISGVYTFKDGGKRDYVGSYEKNLLEFYDQILNVHSSEIMTPGPTIEYTFKGEKHFWITDLYYITANLAHDAKDGGDNPNNREMKDYRDKQIAKEKAITEQGEYNYIRLTNNNFEQLLQTLTDIKFMMLDDTIKNKTISRIYEYTAVGGMNPVIGSSGNYIINYGINGAFLGQAYTKDKAMSKIYKIEDGKVKEEKTKDFVETYDYELYKYEDDDLDIEDILLSVSDDEYIDKLPDYIKESSFIFYELLTGNRYIDENQIYNDDRFTRVDSLYEHLDKVNEIISNSLNEEFNEYIGSPTLSLESFNKLEEDDLSKIKEFQNENGIYIKNIDTGMRSGYYDTINDIPKSIWDLIK